MDSEGKETITPEVGQKTVSIKIIKRSSSIRLEQPASKEFFCTVVNQGKGFTLRERQAAVSDKVESV